MPHVAPGSAQIDSVDASAIRRGLAGESLGAHIYVFADVTSTNAVLRDLADAGAAEGTVVVAESQRAGRGRHDNAWFSPPGLNLHVSVLLRPAIAAAATPVFSFIASLALTDAMWALGVPAAVKWPNDVMIGERKVAGARLDVATDGGRVSYTVLGVGVNVNVPRAELEAALGPLAVDATSLREEVGRPVDRNAFVASFLNFLAKWLELYRGQGPDIVMNAWRARDVLRGRTVTVQEGTEAEFCGCVVGVDARGFLEVDDDRGVRHTVISAAIRPSEKAR
jgi:BirA family transcriptional regulator, biotin operon repressor / biotin---[acetyl-CoA-carboxylase] ligase